MKLLNALLTVGEWAVHILLRITVWSAVALCFWLLWHRQWKDALIVFAIGAITERVRARWMVARWRIRSGLKP